MAFVQFRMSVNGLMESFYPTVLGKNFYPGIVQNEERPVSKDAAYDLQKGNKSNWRRLLLLLGVHLFHFFTRLTSKERALVLIVDGSTFDRFRPNSEELL